MEPLRGGECAVRGGNRPSSGLSDLYTRLARKTIIHGAPGIRSRNVDRPASCYTTDITAVDASPDMLAITATRVDDERVRFVQAGLFTRTPDRRYNVVSIGSNALSSAGTLTPSKKAP